MGTPRRWRAHRGVETAARSWRSLQERTRRHRRLWPLASGATLAALLGLFVWNQRDGFSMLGATVDRADPIWLAVAIALQLALFGMTALSYRLILRRLGYPCRWLPAFGVYLHGVVASDLAPIGEPATAVAVVRALDGRGVARADAFLAWSLVDAIGFAGGFVLLVPTVGLLAAEGRLPDEVLAGAIVMAVLLVLLGVLLTAVLRGGRAVRAVERFVPSRLADFVARARAHHLAARDLWPLLALSVLGELGSVLVLSVMLNAVGGQGGDPAVPLVVYEVGSAAQLLAPVFQGIGAVELAMTLILHRERVAPGAALAATLLFRAGGLWLPVLLWVGMQGMGRARRAMAPR